LTVFNSNINRFSKIDFLKYF